MSEDKQAEEAKATEEATDKQEQASQATEKQAEQATGEEKPISALPSLDEAFGMVKKLARDTSASIGEIYKDYKSRREQNDDSSKS